MAPAFGTTTAEPQHSRTTEATIKIKQLTAKEKYSVACPTCGVGVGKRCVLVAGGLRNEPHPLRKNAATEAVETKRTKR